MTSYLYSSLYKNRRHPNNSHNNQQQNSGQSNQKSNSLRAHFDNENRDLVTIGNNEEIFIPTVQVLNEEDDENII